MELGELVGEPERVSGGYLHRMYSIETTQGNYAVKALNPQICTYDYGIGKVVTQ